MGSPAMAGISCGAERDWPLMLSFPWRNERSASTVSSGSRSVTVASTCRMSPIAAYSAAMISLPAEPAAICLRNISTCAMRG
jgi:hypothetical protein